MVKGNNNKLGELIKLAMGNRTFREYAKDAAVSPASINRIIKGDYIPSSKALKKLSAPQAKPRNGITYEDLMVAAGYQNKNYVSDYDEEYQNEMEYANLSLMTTSQAERISAYANAIQRDNYQRLAVGIIQKELIEKNYIFQTSENSNSSIDFTAYINKTPILEWGFIFKQLPSNSRYSNINRYIREYIGEVTLLPPNSERKISIVVNQTAVFENIILHANKISYRGDLSVILIDLDNYSVESEVYLSTYEMNSKKSIFYIV